MIADAFKRGDFKGRFDVRRTAVVAEFGRGISADDGDGPEVSGVERQEIFIFQQDKRFLGDFLRRSLMFLRAQGR